MNKATMQVYNINSQGSFCFSELLLKGSEQSYRQIGQSCCNRIYIILKLIRPHQRTAQSPLPSVPVAQRLQVFWLWTPDHSICITPTSLMLIQSTSVGSFILFSFLPVSYIGIAIKWEPRKATAILSYLLYMLCMLYTCSYKKKPSTYILTFFET